MFNMTMRYPQWNHITVQSFVFTSAIVSEVRLLKRKKKKKKKNNNNNESPVGSKQKVKVMKNLIYGFQWG